MKKNLIFGLTVSLIMLVSSCAKKEECSGGCQNGGTCVNNSCSCPSGYEGSNCQTKSNAKFVGTYTGSVNCDLSGDTPDSYVITANSSPLAITITEASGDPINATISGNSITIPSQTTASGATVSGSGNLIGGNINIGIHLADGNGGTTFCTFVGSR